MRIRILGSGSKGNAIVVQGHDACVMVDCGFARKRVEERLQHSGLGASDISAVLVTHEHTDHAGGVDRLARGWQVPVYTTYGTARAARWGDVPDLRHISASEQFRIGDLTIQAYAVPHDAAEPVQFVISHGPHRVGILSDAGHITPHMCEVLSGCDVLLLEANHCPQMLADGPYPPALRERVGGPWGHLSNPQSAGLLEALLLEATGHIVLTHLSEQNNTPERAQDAIRGVLNGWAGTLQTALQDQPLDPIEL